MRSMPVVFGSLTVGVIYWIMRESGYPILIAAFSASLILFGESTAHASSSPKRLNR